MTISVVIPTFQEVERIGRLIHYLKMNCDYSLVQIIVVDGGSSDGTQKAVRAAGAHLIQSSKTGRATQMNQGAKAAWGKVLYFVHADAIPPASFCADIRKAISEGYPIGRYRFKFDAKGILLKINAYFTRFDRLWCSGGDLTFFIERNKFEELGGYRDDYQIMEEYEFILRARKKYAYKIIPKDVIVSARKYKNNSWLKVQLANLRIMRMFNKGKSQEEMMAAYLEVMNYR